VPIVSVSFEHKMLPKVRVKRGPIPQIKMESKFVYVARQDIYCYRLET